MKKRNLLLMLAAGALVFGAVPATGYALNNYENPTAVRAASYTAEQISFNSSTVPSGWSIDGTFNSSYYKIDSGKYVTVSAATLFGKEVLSTNFKVEPSIGTFGTWSGAKTVKINVELLDSSNNVLASGNYTSKQLSGSVAFDKGYVSVTKPEKCEDIANVRIYFTNYTSTTSGTLRFGGVKLTYSTEPKTDGEIIGVTGVALSDSTITLKTGESKQITAKVSPEEATNKNVSWSSSNSNVATVTNGMVKAIAKGQATITVTTADGDFNSSCIVTVTDPVYDDDYNLNGTEQYLSNGSYYLKTNGTSAPLAVSADSVESDGPSKLSFYLVGNNQFKIGDEGTGNYLYATNTNNGLRYGTGPTSGAWTNVWTIGEPLEGKGDGDFSISCEVNGNVRYMSLYESQDFRVYLATSNATNMNISTNVNSVQYAVSIDGESEFDLNKNEMTTLTAQYSGGTVAWSVPTGKDFVSLVDNEDGTCTITGLLPGVAKIRATVGDVYDEVTITVSDVQEPVILAGDIIDGLFAGSTGTGYIAWSDKAASSGAIYSGYTSGGNPDGTYVQITNKNNSGIVSTKSGGLIKAINVNWDINSINSASDKVIVYGSHKPYSSSADLYSEETCGTELGRIDYGKTTLELDDSFSDFEYIGITANGALVLTALSVEWKENPHAKHVTAFENSTTKASLSYHYDITETDYDYSNYAMRFGGLIDTETFAGLGNVEDYGVMYASASKSGNDIAAAFEAAHDPEFEYSSVEEGLADWGLNESSVLKNDGAYSLPDIALDSQLNDEMKNSGKQYYLWNAYFSISETNIKKKIAAAAFVVINGVYHFMKTEVYSVQTLAIKYCEMLGESSSTVHDGSLEYLALEK